MRKIILALALAALVVGCDTLGVSGDPEISKVRRYGDSAVYATLYVQVDRSTEGVVKVESESAEVIATADLDGRSALVPLDSLGWVSAATVSLEVDGKTVDSRDLSHLH